MRYLLIFLSLLFAVSAWSQNAPPRPTPEATVRRPPNQKSESTQQQTNTEQRGSDQSPLVIKVLPPEHTQNEPQSNSNKRPSNPNDSWGPSDKIAVIASTVAFLQFVALVWTVLVMIFNGRRELRAYVLPENSEMIEGTMLVPPQPVKANIPGVGMAIKNSGQTPAYRVVSWAQIAVIPVAQENIALVLPPLAEQFSNTLGSGGIFYKAIWFDRPLAANEIADIAAGMRPIYLYGRIEYTDAFKKRHFANFRLHYIGQFPPVRNALLNFSERGNDAN